MNKYEQIKKTMSVREAAEVSGIGRDSLYRLINDCNSDIPYFRVKSKVLIACEPFTEWLNKISKENRRL